MPLISEHFKDIQFDSVPGDVLTYEELVATHLEEEMSLLFIIPQGKVETQCDAHLHTIDIESKLSESEKNPINFRTI